MSHSPSPDKPGSHKPEPQEDLETPRRDFREGQLPGMPVSHDPLREPSPTPPPADIKPLD